MERDTLIRLVAELVVEHLGDDALLVSEATVLFDLPGFDSLAVTSLIDRLEARLGIELPPDIIRPELFETPGKLADAMLRAAAPAQTSNHYRPPLEMR
jgi:acyl carrier protein